jgi:hypothetical protein
MTLLIYGMKLSLVMWFKTGCLNLHEYWLEVALVQSAVGKKCLARIWVSLKELRNLGSY